MPNSDLDEIIRLYNSGEVDAVVERLKHVEGFELNPRLHNFYGVVQVSRGDIQQARIGFEKAIELEPDYAEALANYGALQLKLGEISSARSLIEKALAVDPGNVNAANNLGSIYLRLGERELAEQSYLKAFLADSQQAEACLYFSMIRKWQPDDPLIATIAELYSVAGGTDAWRGRIALALANVYLSLGIPGRAMEYLQEGNRLRKLELPYRVRDDEALFDQLINRFKEDSIPGLELSRQAQPMCPIFIVGMPRSGTSLLEQMLDCHSKITGLGELPYLKQAIVTAEAHDPGLSSSALAAVRSHYMQLVSNHKVGTPYFVDKMPLNFRWIGYISKALPEAHIIHIKRDAEAVCWSNYRTFFAGSGNRFANDLRDVAAFFKLYQKLMQQWDELFPGRIISIEYGALVSAPEAELSTLFQKLDIPWESACLEFSKSSRAVATASALQVRKPIYQNSSEEWKQYADFLMPMLEILKPA